MNRRIVFTCICCLFSLFLQAQTEHFKFMGIPLNGKITKFDRELKKKGFKLDDYASKTLKGSYMYNGIFAGEKSQVLVSYDEKTKIVYQACVIINHLTKENAITNYKSLCSMIEEKYRNNEAVQFYENMKTEHGEEMKKDGIKPFEWKHVFEKDGYETMNFIIPQIMSADSLGTIMVYVEELFSNITYNTEYYLFIRYTDWQNDKLHKNSQINDL